MLVGNKIKNYVPEITMVTLACFISTVSYPFIHLYKLVLTIAFIIFLHELRMNDTHLFRVRPTYIDEYGVITSGDNCIMHCKGLIENIHIEPLILLFGFNLFKKLLFC